MTSFRSKWRDFVPETHRHPTAKTDKRVRASPNTHRHPTDKTDRRSFVGSVSPSSKHLEANGWVAIDSDHLGEVVVLVRDGQGADKVPEGYVIYTVAEIEHLRGIAPDELRHVHQAKKFWNGTITGKREEATTV